MAKIMLVEDDNNLREIYEARLLAEGYEIVSAKDGEEALALAVKERPDLIISDVMMPKISGFDMLDILRTTAETKDTKVIMMTALSQAEDKDRADRLGADRYLVKSQVTLEDVAKVARDVLAGDAAATQPSLGTEPLPLSQPLPSLATDQPLVVPVVSPMPQQEPPITTGAGSDMPVTTNPVAASTNEPPVLPVATQPPISEPITTNPVVMNTEPQRSTSLPPSTDNTSDQTTVTEPPVSQDAEIIPDVPVAAVAEMSTNVAVESASTPITSPEPPSQPATPPVVAVEPLPANPATPEQQNSVVQSPDTLAQPTVEEEASITSQINDLLAANPVVAEPSSLPTDDLAAPNIPQSSPVVDPSLAAAPTENTAHDAEPSMTTAPDTTDPATPEPSGTPEAQTGSLQPSVADEPVTPLSVEPEPATTNNSQPAHQIMSEPPMATTTELMAQPALEAPLEAIPAPAGTIIQPQVVNPTPPSNPTPEVIVQSPSIAAPREPGMPGKRVIQPINDIAPKPSIQDLLQKELATAPTAAPGAASTINPGPQAGQPISDIVPGTVTTQQPSTGLSPGDISL